MTTLSKLLAAAAIFAAAAPAAAIDFSFTGTLPSPYDVQYFDFSIASASTVRVQSWGYAGGVNAAGATIANGGFDTVVALFSLASGQMVGFADDGSDVFDAETGSAFDSLLEIDLAPGAYRVGLSACCNFPLGNLADGYPEFAEVAFSGRSNNWAVDIRNVNSATVGAVPEPASWALLIAGFGLTGAVMRRRRSASFNAS